MRLLFLFLDGVGLGADDPAMNPFARAAMPNLSSLLGGEKLIAGTWSRGFSRARLETERATLIPLDAGLGVSGRPQSATGQATLLTGINVPAALGYHYGPKPNREVAGFLQDGNLFDSLQKHGYRAALLNAYPPGYFAAVKSGRRLLSSIPLAVTSAGIELKTEKDLQVGEALSADFTGQGWRERFGMEKSLLMTPEKSGARLAELAGRYDFSLFEYWLSDYAGHKQDMLAACDLLETFDRILGGLLEAWKDQEGLVLITSDHGNLEDLSSRRHTENPVPCILIGRRDHRRAFASELHDLTGITPAILNFLDVQATPRAKFESR